MSTVSVQSQLELLLLPRPLFPAFLPSPPFTSRTGKMPENSNYRELAAKIA